MKDMFSIAQIEEVLSGVQEENTELVEQVLESVLRLGYKYETEESGPPVEKDAYIKDYKTVIHIRTCIEHGHECSYGHGVPQSNAHIPGHIQNVKDRDDKDEIFCKAYT